MKKILCTVVLLMGVIIMMPAETVMAQDEIYIEVPVGMVRQTINGNTIFDGKGNYLQFETEEEASLFLKAQNQAQSRSFYGYRTTNKFIGPYKYYSKQWAGYNSQTPSWSKASSYVLSKTKSSEISAGMSYEGTSFTVSASVTSRVSTTIPADKNRYSRMGYLVDVTAYRVEVKIYYNNILQSTSYPVIGTITNTYNTVRYQ